MSGTILLPRKRDVEEGAGEMVPDTHFPPPAGLGNLGNYFPPVGECEDQGGIDSLISDR